jgi:hypothetical protein
MTVFSTRAQLEQIARYVQAYVRMPFFDNDAIAGNALEKIIAIVRDAQVLRTYDYVDVVKVGDIGWQVKSTKAGTPLTWKRAKIPGSAKLIDGSAEDGGLAILGKALIDFCNTHALQSIEEYNLKAIGYSRLIVFPDNRVVYFERELCTRENPRIFDPDDFTWSWTTPKIVKVKEQLEALHGVSKSDGGRKYFAWHGKGENQLHFSGEGRWWPEIDQPTSMDAPTFSADGHAISFLLPTDKVDWQTLLDFLATRN